MSSRSTAPVDSVLIRRAAPRRRSRALIGCSMIALALGVAASMIAASPGAATQGTSPAPAAPSRPATAAAPSSAPAAGAVETFKVDPGHSVALFRIVHMGAGAFWGRFDAVSGTISADGANAGPLAFDISIDVNSVNTASTQRDNHLKSPDFFSAKEFPAMTFKSVSAKSVGNGLFDVAGDLTIRGVTKRITAKVEWTGTADKGMGRRCGFEATFTIDRGQFGINYGLDKDALGRDVRVVVALEGVIEKK